jgi:hypothetical protein
LLDAETVERVRALRREGWSAPWLAGGFGVSERTIRRALRGVDADPPSDQADAQAEVALVGIVDKAARAGSWTAAAWLLARRHPELGRPRPAGGGPVADPGPG